MQVYAVGTRDQLDELAGLLYHGPRMAEVRAVNEEQDTVQQLNGFRSG